MEVNHVAGVALGGDCLRLELNHYFFPLFPFTQHELHLSMTPDYIILY